MKTKIESLAFGGYGIAKPKGKTVFIPYALPGEEVEIEIIKEKPSYSFAKLKKVLSPSPDRKVPLCPHFSSCEGCQFQHLYYEKQLEAKQQFVIDAAKRIGQIDLEIDEIVPSTLQYEYREHIRLNLRPKGEGFIAGYIADYKLLPLQNCPLFTSQTIFSKIQDFVSKLQNKGIKNGSLRIFKGLLAFSFAPKLPENHFIAKEALETFQGIIFKSPTEQANYGDCHFSQQINGLIISCSPYGFMQNHSLQAQNLYLKTLNLVPKSTKTLFDLYCGNGILSLLAAKMGLRVIGVESSRESVKKAHQNAKINQLSPIFLSKKVENTLSLFKKYKPDSVILNPPREGLSKQVREVLLTSKPPHLLYISCMPSTLARDLKDLLSHYSIEKCILIDMFPQTTHIETIISLTREFKKKDLPLRKGRS